IEELYAILVKGIRYYLNRQLGPQELDDKVHDTFLIVVHAIQRSEVREPERLIGFVRMIVRRQVSLYLPHMVEGPLDGLEIGPGDTVPDRGRNPEQHSAAPQKVAIAKGVLEQLSGGDREILVRFYVREEPPEQICREMGLTETQFRLAKARAKAQFGELERSSGTRACHFS